MSYPKKCVPVPLTKHPLSLCLIQKKVSLYHSQNTPSHYVSSKKKHPCTTHKTPPHCVSSKKRYVVGLLLHGVQMGVQMILTHPPLWSAYPTKMVKTKQTAKKTAGGRAPRSSKAHARKAPVVKKRRMRNLGWRDIVAL
ncbi:hypothetical protein F5J12DRAFT_786491 [Pisolithus orientalis]|uniref:uncharacterized protein n=1 Tax=Pisolithus orientalis TaxID=936130 RepID=UPI002225407C|nr:uncharacterized protein F5J12DRAFT_786491 [Pisolithus orientalis]KAI5990553.1 hypothetical protein F5J12DRAFT_786491 [Pisolithus orientalis]